MNRKKVKTHAIYVRVSDELLSLIDKKVKQEHFKSRAQYLRFLIREKLFEADIRPPEFPMGSKAWRDAFRKWVKSHKLKTPLLSDEAMRRESIYGHRG